MDMPSTISIQTDRKHGLKLLLWTGLQRYLARNGLHAVQDRLYLGGEASARNLLLLKNHNIKTVISIMSRNHEDQALQLYAANGIRQIYFKKRDEESQEILDILPQCCRLIEAGLANNEDPSASVLVHCVMGISRSATVIIAYIMSRFGMRRSAATEMVKTKRPFIRPNRGFYAQLKIWAACEYALYVDPSSGIRFPPIPGSLMSNSEPNHMDSGGNNAQFDGSSESSNDHTVLIPKPPYRRWILYHIVKVKWKRRSEQHLITEDNSAERLPDAATSAPIPALPTALAKVIDTILHSQNVSSQAGVLNEPSSADDVDSEVQTTGMGTDASSDSESSTDHD